MGQTAIALRWVKLAAARWRSGHKQDRPRNTAQQEKGRRSKANVKAQQQKRKASGRKKKKKLASSGAANGRAVSSFESRLRAAAVRRLLNIDEANTVLPTRKVSQSVTMGINRSPDRSTTNLIDFHHVPPQPNRSRRLGHQRQRPALLASTYHHTRRHSSPRSLTSESHG